MLTNLLLPWLSSFRLDTILATDHRIDLELTAIQIEASCPLCGQCSRAIHSHYDRTIADLPWANTPVRLSVHVRKFFCRNAACSRTVFTERLPALVAPSARRTQRLSVEQRQIALDQGGEAGTRTATRQGMPVSPRTLLRLARRTPALNHPPPKIVGVDDFAFRKGQTYGTLLVDLERHQPIDMLGDRSAETLASWLVQHPSVEILTRDRAPDYADGATRGAPQAIQVADRFHLLTNLRETVQRLLDRHQAVLRNAVVPPPADVVDPPTSPPAASLPTSPPTTAAPAPALRTRQEREHQQRRRRWLARYSEIRALHDQGHGIRAIARQLDISRQTVRRILCADQFPEYGARSTRSSKLERYIPYLHQQLAAGNDNALALWRDLRDHHGYVGSRSLVSTWVAQHRHLYCEQLTLASCEYTIFDATSLAEPIVQRMTQQYMMLAHALQWSSPDAARTQGHPPTPLHADLALFVSIANDQLDRGAVDDQLLGDIIERFQHLLDLLFKPVSGYYGYSIPPNFWTTTPLGQVLARVQAWLRGDDLISYTDAAYLLFPDMAATNPQAARMRVKRLVERGVLQSYSDLYEPNPTQQSRISRQAAEALKAAGQHLQADRRHRSRKRTTNDG
jgi:DNA-binding NarL/FixJ family response regulator